MVSSINFSHLDSDEIINLLTDELEHGGKLKDLTEIDKNLNYPLYLVIYNYDVIESGMEYSEGLYLKYLAVLDKTKKLYTVKKILYSEPSMDGRIKNASILEAKKDKSISKDFSDKEEINNYCNLSTNSAFKFLTENSPFKFGNNSIVEFQKKYNYQTESWRESNVIINGGFDSSKRLRGSYYIDGNFIFIENLIAINGNFDASKNIKVFGRLKIQCNGDITGTLRDINGNRKDLVIKFK